VGTAGGEVHVRCLFKNDITGVRGREKKGRLGFLTSLKHFLERVNCWVGKGKEEEKNK